MAQYKAPGVYIEEVSNSSRSIKGEPTNVTGFVGTTQHVSNERLDNNNLINIPTQITSWSQFMKSFGTYDESSSPFLALSVKAFFDNGGGKCYIVRVPDQATSDDYIGNARSQTKTGLAALEEVAINLLCIPGVTETSVQQAMIAHCENHPNRFCLLDTKQTDDMSALKTRRYQINSGFGALYYPWLMVSDLQGNTLALPPSGVVAGICAQVDTARGVHKAPANIELRGVLEVDVDISNNEQSSLNVQHINAIRHFPGRGIRVWGARTLSTDPEWKYINVRRLCSFVEHSIENSTEWVVFGPNAASLWSAVKSSIENFLTTLWRDGMLTGATTKEAFFVRCDRTTMTQNDIDNGRLIINTGIAPIKPAEFVIIRIDQKTLT